MKLPIYQIQTAINNAEWGTVDGGGTYPKGDEATLTATPAMFCIFDGWSDGNEDSPRTVTVMQDILFTAIFHYDSAWEEDIEMVGNLEFSVSPSPKNGQLTVRTNLPDTMRLLFTI